jgi:hypothetical protein
MMQVEAQMANSHLGQNLLFRMPTTEAVQQQLL